MLDSQNIVPLFLDLLSLFLWMYVASSFGRGRDAFFNLYVNRVRRWLFAPVAFVQRLFPRIPDWGAALVLLAVAAAARFLHIRAAGGGVYAAWRAAAHPLEIICALNFIRAAMQWRCGRARAGGVQECLDTVCFPFSNAPPARSAAYSAGALFALAFALAFPGPYRGAAAHALIMAFGALRILCALVGAGIFASIAGTLLGMRDVSGMAHEWLEALMRIFTRQKLLVAMFDLTPLVVYFAADYIYGVAWRNLAT